MMSAPRLLSLCVLILLASGAAAQQPTEAVLPAENAVIVGGGKIALGDARASVLARTRPANTRGNEVYYPHVTVKFGPDDRVYLIEMAGRFSGKTPGGIGTSSKVQDAIVEFPALAKVKKGWNDIGKLGFWIPGGTVITGLRFKTSPGPAPRNPPPPARGGDGGGRRGGDRGSPPPRRGDGRGRGGSGGGDRGAGRGGAGFDDARGRRRDRVEVWSRTWRTDGRRWTAAPVGTWPTDRGVLLVRVDHDDRVTGCNHRFFGRDVTRIARGDHVFSAGIVESHRRGRRGAEAWEWHFAGSGQVKVAIHWFDRRANLDTWVARHPFTGFRIPGAPRRGRAIDPLLGRYDRLAGDVRKVWEKSWRTRENYGWVDGPEQTWPRDSGVLLLRVAASRGVNAFFYRVGQRKVEIGPGDHVLPADVLPAGGLILDRRDRSLRFAAAGEGPVRVEVYWVPERAVCDRWCREHPFSISGTRLGVPAPIPVAPVEGPSNPVEALAWLFGGAAWRARDDYEQDWTRHGFEDLRGTVNVASPRHGALLSHSSRDGRNSRGYETDGGLWYSAPSRHAWTQSRFYCPSRIDRIDIATAGSSRRAARYIIVELQREDGAWVRAAGFHRENINWYRTEGGSVVSRPPVSIPVDGRQTYVALRILFAGAGPFRIGGVAVHGRFVGDPRFHAPDPFGAPAGEVVVASGGGWVDTACDIRSGASFYVDVDGLLLGRVGDGATFEVRAGRPVVVRRSGRLWLRHADPRGGALTCVIVGGSFGEPVGAVADEVVVSFRGTLRDDRSRRSIQGADVIVQLEAWPRTVFGGGRTDERGEYAFDVVIPRGVPVVVRVPEYKTESVPQVFGASGPHRWEGWIR